MVDRTGYYNGAKAGRDFGRMSIVLHLFRRVSTPDRTIESAYLSPDGEHPSPTTLEVLELPHLSEEAAQELMEDLWAAGFRPAGAAPQDGETKALRDHLGDLRRLVEKSHGVELGS